MPNAKKSLKYWRCDCGRKARYRLRLTLLRSDLETEIKTSLYLCENCYQLEQQLGRGEGRKPLQATRLG